MDERMFYDIGKTISYNKLFNFVVGIRGVGKTYGFKKWAISSFLKTGKQFVYLRRYQKELSKIGRYFDDIVDKFPEHELKVDKSGVFLIDNEIAGFTMCLSKGIIEKSISFPKVDKLCFDEFIIREGNYRYLKGEVEIFYEVVETIFRMRDFRAFLFGNNISINNPYFMQLNLKLPNPQKVWTRGEYLVENSGGEEYREFKKNTRLGKALQDTTFGRYAYDNESLLDSNTFIEKKTGNLDYTLTIKVKDTMLGVWANWDKGLLYVSQDCDPSWGRVFALTKEDHEPNTLLLKGRMVNTLKRFVDMYKMGNVRFESQKVKLLCDYVLKETL